MRPLSVRYKRRYRNYHNTSLFFNNVLSPFETALFAKWAVCGVWWGFFVWLFFEGIGGLTVKWNIPGLSEITFLKKFGRAVSLSWGTESYSLSWHVKASADHFHIISMCVLQKEKSWGTGWNPAQKIEVHIPKSSLQLRLDKVFFHSLYKLFCCYFNSFRALPLTSILNDEQSDPFSLLPNLHWLFCH